LKNCIEKHKKPFDDMRERGIKRAEGGTGYFLFCSCFFFLKKREFSKSLKSFLFKRDGKINSTQHSCPTADSHTSNHSHYRVIECLK